MASADSRAWFSEDVANNYAQALGKLRSLKKARDRIKSRLESLEVVKGLARARGELQPYQAPASDRAGRNAELAEFLKSDEEYQAVVRELEPVLETLAETEDQIASLKFSQKERQMDSVADFKEALVRFEKLTKNLAAAADVFAVARGTRPRR